MVKTNCCQEKAGCCCKRGVRIGLVSLGVIAVVSGIGAGLWYGYDHWVKESKTLRDMMKNDVSFALEQLDAIKETKVKKKTEMKIDDIKSGINGVIDLEYGILIGFENGRKMVNAINETLESALVATKHARYFNGDHEQLSSEFDSQIDVLRKLVDNRYYVSLSNQSVQHCFNLIKDDLNELKPSMLSDQQRTFKDSALYRKVDDNTGKDAYVVKADMDDVALMQKTCIESLNNAVEKIDAQEMDTMQKEKVAEFIKIFEKTIAKF